MKREPWRMRDYGSKMGVDISESAGVGDEVTIGVGKVSSGVVSCCIEKR
jgi:hypothetical protein